MGGTRIAMEVPNNGGGATDLHSRDASRDPFGTRHLATMYCALKLQSTMVMHLRNGTDYLSYTILLFTSHSWNALEDELVCQSGRFIVKCIHA